MFTLGRCGSVSFNRVFLAKNGITRSVCQSNRPRRKRTQKPHTMAMAESPEATTTTVENITLKPIGFFHAVISQANFQSRLHKESWYGHHYPFRRVAFFTLLFVVVGAWSAVLSWPLGREETKALSDLNVDCLQQLSIVVQLLPACIVDPEGVTAKMDFDNYQGPSDIPFPESCSRAISLMDGAVNTAVTGMNLHEQSNKTGEANNSTASVNFIHFESLASNNTNATEAFLTLDEQCRLISSFGEEKHSLLSMDERQQNKGRTVQPKFKDVICNTVIPMVILLQTFLLGSYTFTLTCVFTASFVILGVGHVLALMLDLLITTFVLRLFLKWPKTLVGYEKITYGTVWWNLLVLSKVNARYCDYTGITFWVSLLFCGAMMDLSTRLYQDREAARSWLDLAVVWHGFPLLVPYLDLVRTWIHRFDMLDLLGWVSTFVNMLVPGSGWEKYVFIWVFWQTYPYQKHIKSRVLKWIGLQSTEDSDEEDHPKSS